MRISFTVADTDKDPDRIKKRGGEDEIKYGRDPADRGIRKLPADTGLQGDLRRWR